MTFFNIHIYSSQTYGIYTLHLPFSSFILKYSENFELSFDDREGDRSDLPRPSLAMPQAYRVGVHAGPWRGPVGLEGTELLSGEGEAWVVEGQQLQARAWENSRSRLGQCCSRGATLMAPSV